MWRIPKVVQPLPLSSSRTCPMLYHCLVTCRTEVLYLSTNIVNTAQIQSVNTTNGSFHFSFDFYFSYVNDATLSPLPPLFQLKIYGMLTQRTTVEVALFVG